MKRSLRISGFKDYIAVDVIEEKTGRIIATPFYLRPEEKKRVLVIDRETCLAIPTTVQINNFTELKCTGDDGFTWESPFEELTNPNIFVFM